MFTSSPKPPRSRRVVIAEDEMLVRACAAMAFADAGFEVLEVAGADEAIVLLAQHASDIGLLFTDVQMPGSMTGLDLAHHVVGHWPWIGLLITSGAAPPKPEHMPANSRFLPKPYDPDHALGHAKELLAAA